MLLSKGEPLLLSPKHKLFRLSAWPDIMSMYLPVESPSPSPRAAEYTSYLLFAAGVFALA